MGHFYNRFSRACGRVFINSHRLGNNVHISYYDSSNDDLKYAAKQTVIAPDIIVTPASINFGRINAGASSSQAITVKNDGAASPVIGNIAQANPVAAPFSITTDNCSGQTLAPDESCTLIVSFAPVSAGSFSDTFDIPSNDPDESSVTVSLNATSTLALYIRGTDSLGNQLIYDSDKNITWYDYTKPADTWQNINSWASALSVNFNGRIYDDWKLPETLRCWSDPTKCSDKGMEHLYHAELGNSSPPINTGPFINLQPSIYWEDIYLYTGSYFYDFLFGIWSLDDYLYANGFAMRVGDVVTDPDVDVDGDGYSVTQGDCHDTNASINPGAVEICDFIDNNCDGQIDEGFPLTYYRDADNDSYGNQAITVQACIPQPAM